MAEPTGNPAGRVVLVTHSSALGGAEIGLTDLAIGLPGSTVCLFEDGPLREQLRSRGIAVQVLDAGVSMAVRRDHGISRALIALPDVLRLTMRLARATRPGDLLYGNSQKAWVICALAACFARRRALWHLHDILGEAHFSRLMSRIGVLLANRFARAVIVNSAATGESFVQNGGRRSLLRLVHNGIDEGDYQAAAAVPREELRRQLGLRPGVVVVGLFGRITPWKGQHVLLQAMLALPDVEALIVGGPLFGEGDYLRELEQRAAASGIEGRVRFLGFRSDVAQIMRAVDIVVHASTAPEPFGRVIVEGMLSRRPVIASRAGGVPEIIADGEDGLLVTPGDAAALASAIRSLREDPARADALAEAGYVKARNRFLVKHMLAELQPLTAAAGGWRT